jgi:uncharacterized protein YlxP (DUF503 family)
MHSCAVRLELHIPAAQSLKSKRAVLRPHIERLRKLASLSIAEVDNHDFWQRASLGVAIVAPDAAQLDSLIERVRRYFDDQVDIELLEVAVSYLEEP